MKSIDRSSLTITELDQVRAISTAYVRYEDFLKREHNHPELRERIQAWQDAAALTIARKSTAQEISAIWSKASDEVIKKIFSRCFQTESVAIFALGKLGAEELNLSSDVDLIIVAENSESQEQATRDLRKFQAAFQVDSFFLYRLDFNLRPGGRFSSIVSSLDQFTDYFGNYGETWERMALCRLRFLTGSQSIAHEILNFRTKFSFRRHLDYTIFDDFAILRSKIQNSKKESDQLINLKFSLGGIRDIELFLHSMQVAHGGRARSLQTHKTNDVFAALSAMTIMTQADLHQLQKSYWQLRELENYTQSIEDAHTHSIKLNEQIHPHWVQSELSKIDDLFFTCSNIISKFIKVPTAVSQSETTLNPAVVAAEQSLQELINSELNIEIFSRNKERDLHYRNIFLHDFVFHVHQVARDNQDSSQSLQKANLNLLEFLQVLRAKTSFFSMFAREKKISELLAIIFSSSDYLSTILQNRPELLDSILLKKQSALQKGGEAFYEDLVEKKLLTELLLGIEFLRGASQSEVCNSLSSVADEIGFTLIEQLKGEYGITDLSILCLGKWGGCELGFQSDLDFVFVCKDEPNELTYKVARRFISRLTEPHRGGSIYDIDVRLKPSGKGGPMICHWAYLLNFLSCEAEPWERQAYLKARLLAPASPTKIDLNIEDLLQANFAKALTPEDYFKLNDIRQKLISKNSIKYTEGGLVDIEFSVQTAILENAILPKGPSILDHFEFLIDNDRANYASWLELKKIYFNLRTVEQAERLENYAFKNQSVELDQDLDFASKTNSIASAASIDRSRGRLDAASMLAASSHLLLSLDPRRRSS